MRVTVDEREYTLYVGAYGLWVMHTYNVLAPEGEQWLDTSHDVSNCNPFESVVTYDAWR